MSISSIGGTSALNQAYLAQQAQSVLGTGFDPQTAASTSATAGSATAAGSNALTGLNASPLDSQTLQALMDLTQQDPAASDPSAADATGQSGQAKGAHHHHHHGGMMPAQANGQPNDPSAAQADPASSTDAFGVQEADAADGEDPLLAALSQS